MNFNMTSLGGLPLGSANRSDAPWNQKDDDWEYDRCPECGERDSFWSRKDKKWVCRNCWNKWDE